MLSVDKQVLYLKLFPLSTLLPTQTAGQLLSLFSFTEMPKEMTVFTSLPGGILQSD